ncbi:hypothetical protein QQM39_14510 [Streptomyces sp. DT2A-34]|uniref:hypothetical protein n=1 Tax=Streptomyces sp. DT2A-34 TaxID=3051182 RepID=UPI00265C7C54|nr:hypothetical protein [Streptomyces sp. DT2A-34]MDO0912013.1 hypothetical protein [Streptomyces sp. DT2A-34]
MSTTRSAATTSGSASTGFGIAARSRTNRHGLHPREHHPRHRSHRSTVRLAGLIDKAKKDLPSGS